MSKVVLAIGIGLAMLLATVPSGVGPVPGLVGRVTAARAAAAPNLPTFAIEANGLRAEQPLACMLPLASARRLAFVAATDGPGKTYLPAFLLGALGAGPGSFLEPFTGTPLNPQAWKPANWDVTVHTRRFDRTEMLSTMQADHGPQCEPPPATHTITTYEEAVYICANHVMTALNDPDYGVIYLTPNHLVDFSNGTATISFDMSTLRRSGRDWVDLWITPFADHLQLPLDNWLPDLNGPPRRAVHLRMDFVRNNSTFLGEVINDFNATALTLREPKGYESVLSQSAMQRDTFELQISRNHIKFGLPAYDLWWIDQAVADLSWTQGVVQFGHHSYTPEKDCGYNGTCGPNTWHWDNVSITPARPFTMIAADRRYLNADTPSTVTLAAPTPANAYLRFAGIGASLEVSFDQGGSWTTATTQAQSMHIVDHFQSYWMPIPAGVTSVQFRGQSWWGGGWHVRDISVWSNGD